jgi:hypothetical protein
MGHNYLGMRDDRECILLNRVWAGQFSNGEPFNGFWILVFGKRDVLNGVWL